MGRMIVILENKTKRIFIGEADKITTKLPEILKLAKNY